MSNTNEASFDDSLVLCGYQKKLSTMKKKFFAVYKDTTNYGARLEYYDNMKKFKSGTAPKRIIKLATCLNINRRFDTKRDYVISLATTDGGFGIVLESEDEMFKWLEALLSLQRSSSNKQDACFPTFDHVWQVVVQKKNLAEERQIVGSYHVCLSSKSVIFRRIGSEKSSAGFMRATDIQIPLNTIRRCGDSHCLFYMEVGRQCTIGPGELWMETEDPLVAQSMHKMISRAMSTSAETLSDSLRKRSLSVSETSKSTRAMEMVNMNLENEHYNMNISASSNPLRGRCDSFPSRARRTDDFETAHAPSLSNCSMVHRPLTQPRYNSSSPIPPAFANTERRETVNVDDEEKTGNYLAFRFKSAERPIPEENSEDVLSSDNMSYHKGAYISKTPEVKSLDLTENKKSHQEIRNDTTTLLVTSDIITQMHAILISTDNELYSEERPKRSYSVGSKIDKTKMKRLGNSNDILQDANSGRVRAFSVGARAKIPKCGLQRSVLFPKSQLNQSCISNNSLNLGIDDAGYKSELKSSCNKKSTSAPILIQNGQVAIDCMSDLMEIDFSKGSNHKAHKSVSVNEKHYGICLNEFKSTLTLPHLKSICHEDSGYLEMRPVECVKGYPDYFVKMSTTKDINSGNMEFKCVKKGKHISGAVSKKRQPAMDIYYKDNENDRRNKNAEHFEEDKLYHTPHSANMAGNSSIYSNLKRLTCLEMDADSSQSCVIFLGDKRNKAIQNICLEKIMSSESQREKQENINFPENRDRVSTDISPLEFDFSSNECSYANKEKLRFLLHSMPDNKTAQTGTNICSPSSSNCYELHYAKLDLPQCSTKENKKYHKTDLCNTKKTVTEAYAKIDFDHSSDSSSSSKILLN